MKSEIWFAVDKDGEERIYNGKPKRDVGFFTLDCISGTTEFGCLFDGTIESITGQKLTWSDEPLKFR